MKRKYHTNEEEYDVVDTSSDYLKQVLFIELEVNRLEIRKADKSIIEAHIAKLKYNYENERKRGLDIEAIDEIFTLLEKCSPSKIAKVLDIIKNQDNSDFNKNEVDNSYSTGSVNNLTNYKHISKVKKAAAFTAEELFQALKKSNNNNVKCAQLLNCSEATIRRRKENLPLEIKKNLKKIKHKRIKKPTYP